MLNLGSRLSDIVFSTHGNNLNSTLPRLQLIPWWLQDKDRDFTSKMWDTDTNNPCCVSLFGVLQHYMSSANNLCCCQNFFLSLLPSSRQNVLISVSVSPSVCAVLNLPPETRAPVFQYNIATSTCYSSCNTILLIKITPEQACNART